MCERNYVCVRESVCVRERERESFSADWWFSTFFSCGSGEESVCESVCEGESESVCVFVKRERHR